MPSRRHPTHVYPYATHAHARTHARTEARARASRVRPSVHSFGEKHASPRSSTVSSSHSRSSNAADIALGKSTAFLSMIVTYRSQMRLGGTNEREENPLRFGNVVAACRTLRASSTVAIFVDANYRLAFVGANGIGFRATKWR